MPKSNNCNSNIDSLKLIRDGANQDQRLIAALNPEYAPVNEHSPEHGMMFAHSLSEFLRFYDNNNTENGTWKPFFEKDISVRIAIAAVQQIDDYTAQIKSYLDFLNNLDNDTDDAALINNLSYIFSTVGTLAKQLDILKEGLSVEIQLKPTLKNLIKGQLAGAFQRLIAYYKGGLELAVVADVTQSCSIKILNTVPETFQANLSSGFSTDWIVGSYANWNDYLNDIVPEKSVFGNPAGSVFDKTNHIATHNLFTTVLDQFLKVYSRVVSDAKTALEATFTNWNQHDPHYTLFLSFLRLFEHARAEANTITGRHLDFYYREVLRLKEKPAVPGQVHLLAELAKQATTFQFKKDDLFKAGKDGLGKEAFFANNRDFIANQAKVSSLKTIYRHGLEKMGGSKPYMHAHRMYASPVANSDDGLGSALTSPDLSWNPFYNKIHHEGVLQSINMPNADVGFAIASHYLLMAEGTRVITVDLANSGMPNIQAVSRGSQPIESKIPFVSIKDFYSCQITTEKGWFEITDGKVAFTENLTLIFIFTLTGADPAVKPYLEKVHARGFATNLPVLEIKLKNGDNSLFWYNFLQFIEIQNIFLSVEVYGLKTLKVSNDFGPVDTSKPFQPFGANPLQGSSLVIGSKELFQKSLASASILTEWQTTPVYFANEPKIVIDFLKGGDWTYSHIDDIPVGCSWFELSKNLDMPVIAKPDFSPDEAYTTSSRHGFTRFRLNSGFGMKEYQTALITYLATKEGLPPVGPPIGPFMTSLSVDYLAKQTISLSSSNVKTFETREASFLHIAPFGFAEQHAIINKDKKVFLFPQFEFERNGVKKETEAELYIGVTGLQPPQNLSLLFHVSDGTANPLTVKPNPHLHWSYLKNNEWIAFENNDVEDQTDGLLKSGIITFAIPADATNTNNLLPFGEHWIRAAVWGKSDAVCNLITVAAQAFEATFADKGNDPAFSATVLPSGTISKPAVPDASVKKITQPFESFGGRGAEEPTHFYRRVSERLRHKDRAITLWDYEHAVLEAFPEIYRVKCLNHTQYEPNESGTGIYRELAPGNVTLVTVPNHKYHNLRDPLRPYTSLGLLGEIAEFLQARSSCFVNLHVRNPQFEQVRVKCKLKISDGFDETFYTKLLQEAIMNFLSPWAFVNEGSPSFGGKIYKSVLLDFIEEQQYVDYVTDFELFHDINGKQGTENKNEIEGSLAVSILVSVPANHHEILVINTKEVETASEKCNCQP
jgi:hypothetical protein